MPSVTISIGELADKYTVLCIKHKHGNNVDISRKIDTMLMLPDLKMCIKQCPQFIHQLRYVNEQIWKDRNAVQNAQNAQNDWAELAVNLVHNTEARSRLRHKINLVCNSDIHEYKGYPEKKAFVLTHLGLGDILNEGPGIRYLAMHHDTTTVVCFRKNKPTVEALFADDPTINLYLIDHNFEISPTWGGEVARAKLARLKNAGYTLFLTGDHVQPVDEHHPRSRFYEKHYEQMGVPYNEIRWHPGFLYVERHPERETSILEKAVKHQTRYCIVHDKPEQGVVIDDTDLPEDLPLYHPNRDMGRNAVPWSGMLSCCLFDYGKLFEQAEEIHVIDSSFQCMSDYLNLENVKKLKLYSRDQRIYENFSRWSWSYPWRDGNNTTKIAILNPVSTRNRNFTSILETELYSVFFPSFIEHISPNYVFTLYLGYDPGDTVYDNAESRDLFVSKCRSILRDYPELKVEFVWYQCQGCEHAPAWAWNQIFKKAYEDGNDYFYQLGDDVMFLTSGWEEKFINILQNNPICPNFGMVGPHDINMNEHQLETVCQTFVSRVHYEIFGFYFDPKFRSWWCDNWLTLTYAKGTNAIQDMSVKVYNSSECDVRYDIVSSHIYSLWEARDAGKNKIIKWLSQRRGEQKKIISFSLWGNNPKYTQGAIINAQLAEEIFPEWICRFYVDESTVPEDVTNNLRQRNNCEIIMKHESENWSGLWWRFEAFADLSAAVVLSRDTDSRLSYRERDMINMWLRNDANKWFCTIRDHPNHSSLAAQYFHILGGMWGMKRNTDLPPHDFSSLLDKRRNVSGYADDEHFLEESVWPKVENNAFIFDEFGDGNNAPHVPRGTNIADFIGQSYDENNVPDSDYTKVLHDHLRKLT